MKKVLLFILLLVFLVIVFKFFQSVGLTLFVTSILILLACLNLAFFTLLVTICLFYWVWKFVKFVYYKVDELLELAIDKVGGNNGRET